MLFLQNNQVQFGAHPQKCGETRLIGIEKNLNPVTPYPEQFQVPNLDGKPNHILPADRYQQPFHNQPFALAQRRLWCQLANHSIPDHIEYRRILRLLKTHNKDRIETLQLRFHPSSFHLLLRNLPQ